MRIALRLVWLSVIDSDNFHSGSSILISSIPLLTASTGRKKGQVCVCVCVCEFDSGGVNNEDGDRLRFSAIFSSQVKREVQMSPGADNLILLIAFTHPCLLYILITAHWRI